MIIQLTRQKPTANGQQPTANRPVHGTLSLPFDPSSPLTYDTLENADYLIPEGTYPLKLTWSPKFRKDMPLIDEVPEREGIRIHCGTRPEHSTGCILVNIPALENIKIFINKCHKYEEELYIRIATET